jgi:HPr kinase/phosphorylase
MMTIINNLTIQNNQEIIQMEIYRLKVLILGNFGVLMSETTIELIKRGHRLIINDDLKDIKLIVNLIKSDYKNNYNSISIGKQYNELLNLNAFKLEIPVKLEQNIPIIIETAAINVRLINMGYDKDELLMINNLH